MPTPRTPVVSTSIASIGFDAKRGQLDIEFCTGALYRYSGVPQAVFAALIRAESKGLYFTQVIRDHFEYRCLAGPRP